MCFGPSKAEKKAAAEQRIQAEEARNEAARQRAEQKREDISDALSASVQRQGGMRGGTGRRSLFRAGSSGFLGRFR